CLCLRIIRIDRARGTVATDMGAPWIGFADHLRGERAEDDGHSPGLLLHGHAADRSPEHAHRSLIRRMAHFLRMGRPVLGSHAKVSGYGPSKCPGDKACPAETRGPM